MSRAGRKRSTAERYACGKPRPKAQSDYGTVEQHRILVISFEVTEDAGIERARNRSECLLDRLLDEGALGKGDEAIGRHSAGIWLRGLHERAFHTSITGTYGPHVRSSDPYFPDPHRVGLGRLIREAGVMWGVLRPAVIDGIRPKSLERLNESLDWLQAWR